MKKIFLISLVVSAMFVSALFASSVRGPLKDFFYHIRGKHLTLTGTAIMGTASVGTLNVTNPISGIFIPRHDTSANLDSITLQEGEVATTSDTRESRVGDGSTPGGIVYHKPGVNVSGKTAATYTVGTDNAFESFWGTVFINNDNDALALTLDSAVERKSGCIAQGPGVSAAITVTPGAGDRFLKDSTALTVATAYTSGGTGAAKLCWVAIDDTHWLITTQVGPWSE